MTLRTDEEIERILLAKGFFNNGMGYVLTGFGLLSTNDIKAARLIPGLFDKFKEVNCGYGFNQKEVCKVFGKWYQFSKRMYSGSKPLRLPKVFFDDLKDKLDKILDEWYN